MAREDPRASLPGADEYARRCYFVWRARQPNEANDPVLAWAEAWRQGGWDALHRSAQVADLIPRLEELVALYRAVQVEHEVEQSVSPYWQSHPTGGFTL